MKTNFFLPFVLMALFLASCSPSDLIKKIVDVEDLEEEEKDKKVVYRYQVTVHNGEHKGTYIYEETDPTYYYAQYIYDQESKKYFVTGTFTHKDHSLSMYMNATKQGAHKVILEHPLSQKGESIIFAPPAERHLTLASVSGEILIESMSFTPSDIVEDHGFVSMNLTFSGTFINFSNEKEEEVEITGSVEMF